MLGMSGARNSEMADHCAVRVTTTSLAELCGLVQDRFLKGDDHAAAELVWWVLASGNARFVDRAIAVEPGLSFRTVRGPGRPTHKKSV